nr:spore germination protein [Clostridia bacterium]
MDNENERVVGTSVNERRPFFTQAEGGFERCCEYCEMLKGKSNDVLIKRFTLADGRKCALVMVDGMCNKSTVERGIVLSSRRFSSESTENKFDPEDGLLQQFASIEYSRTDDLLQGYITALTGDVLMIFEGLEYGYNLGYREIPSRTVNESPNEGVVRGPHEAFTENLRTNTALIRRRISDPNMVIEHLRVGRRSHTTVALCYIRGLTNSE